jgi:serine/threonine protein kinase
MRPWHADLLLSMPQPNIVEIIAMTIGQQPSQLAGARSVRGGGLADLGGFLAESEDYVNATIIQAAGQARSFCIRKRIVHHDIKLQNILSSRLTGGIGSNYCDFASCCVFISSTHGWEFAASS